MVELIGEKHDMELLKILQYLVPQNRNNMQNDLFPCRLYSPQSCSHGHAVHGVTCFFCSVMLHHKCNYYFLQLFRVCLIGKLFSMFMLDLLLK